MLEGCWQKCKDLEEMRNRGILSESKAEAFDSEKVSRGSLVFQEGTVKAKWERTVVPGTAACTVRLGGREKTNSLGVPHVGSLQAAGKETEESVRGETANCRWARWSETGWRQECLSCGVRFTERDLTLAGLRYRCSCLCGRCAEAMPVTCKKQLQVAVEAALRWLRKHRVTFHGSQQQKIPVVLMDDMPSSDSSRFHRLASTVMKYGKSIRVPSTKLVRRGAGAMKSDENLYYCGEVQRIEIRSGLPMYRVIGSLIHELLHAWLLYYRIRHNVDPADVPTSIRYRYEEAFCHTATYLYWRELARQEQLAPYYDLFHTWAHKVLRHDQYINETSEIKNAFTTQTLRSLAVSIATMPP